MYVTCVIFNQPLVFRVAFYHEENIFGCSFFFLKLLDQNAKGTTARKQTKAATGRWEKQVQ